MLALRRSARTSVVAGAVLVAAGLSVPAACSRSSDATSAASSRNATDATDGSDAAGSPAAGGSAATSPVLMSADEIAALIAAPPGPLAVLDVRTPEEYAGGHLAGAVEMDVHGASFTANATLLDRSLHYVVYCRSGNRSAQAVRLLSSLGFEHLYELDGGITAWQDAGFPVVRG